MATLEGRIDELYQVPLPDFGSARAALAKTLSGANASRIKALKKPTVVPWAVNQLFWFARPTYGALMKRGTALRRAQVSSLKGRTTDVRQATEAHREAAARAVKEATRLAASRGVQVDPDALARTVEALSLAEHSPEPAGRLTSPLQAAGFEALAGVAITASSRTRAEVSKSSRRPEDSREAKAEEEHAREAAIRKAERAWDRAREREEAARRAWSRAKADLDKAERELTTVRH